MLHRGAAAQMAEQGDAITAACAERAVSDVAAVADPTTGVAVYDTYQLPGWTVFGGTSVATQVIRRRLRLAEGSGPTAGRALYTAPATGLLRCHRRAATERALRICAPPAPAGTAPPVWGRPMEPPLSDHCKGGKWYECRK